MVNPNEAHKVLQGHFSQLTPSEFEDGRKKYAGLDDVPTSLTASVVEGDGLILFQREPAPLQLNAYLATALTGLEESARKSLFGVSDIVGSVCSELDIDLYQPRQHTDPVSHPDVSAEDVHGLDRERVLNSDLLIHIADHPSTGAGEELDFASNALVPVILISHGESRVSRMVTGIPAFKLIVEYTDVRELQEELRRLLMEIRPILEERKLVFAEFDQNIVGNKVRILRQDLLLTREDIVSASNSLMTTSRLKQIEESTDKTSNPSLLEMRTLAALLKTTVADLAEPDLSERIFGVLQEWMSGKVAARYLMSDNDQRRVIRRILYRVCDNLDSIS